MKYEKIALSNITKLRKITISLENREEVNSKTESILGRLLIIFENYPNLKDDESVRGLMEQGSYLEREISAARKLYNLR